MTDLKEAAEMMNGMKIYGVTFNSLVVNVKQLFFFVLMFAAFLVNIECSRITGAGIAIIVKNDG